MGTIIKRNNLYSIVYDEPTTDGERNQVMRSVRKLGGSGTNYKEAQTILAEIERKIRRGEYTNSGHSVESFLEEWLTYAETQVAATTYREYLNACRRHLIPKLGKVTLDQLTPVHVKNAYKKLQDNGLAPKTVKNIHNVLRGALEQAIRWRMLTSNPAALVDPPRYVRPDIQIAEGEQLRLILDRLRGREWYLPTLIAFATGMRRGEVLALQWQDFNEEARVLIVRRSLARVRDSEIILKETKSGRVRVVAIPDALVTELVAHRKASAFTKPADWIACRKDARTWRRAACR